MATRPLDFETVEKLLAPATVRLIAGIAAGRGQAVRAVMIAALNELELYEALVSVPVRPRPSTDTLIVEWKQTLGAAPAPLSADFYSPVLDTTRSRIESLAAQRGQPLELVAADAIEFYFGTFIH